MRFCARLRSQLTVHRFRVTFSSNMAAMLYLHNARVARTVLGFDWKPSSVEVFRV